MLKMIVFTTLFMISFAALFMVREDLKVIAAAVGMIVSGMGFLIIATAEHDENIKSLKHSDLYDYSAE